MNFVQALTHELHRWQDETVWLTVDVVRDMLTRARRRADDITDLLELLTADAGAGTATDSQPGGNRCAGMNPAGDARDRR